MPDSECDYLTQGELADASSGLAIAAPKNIIAVPGHLKSVLNDAVSPLRYR